MRERLRRLAAAVAWLAAVAVVALGAAGLVAATNVPPAPGTRPELTWANDQALGPELADGGRRPGRADRPGRCARGDRSQGPRRPRRTGTSPAVQAATAEGDAQLADDPRRRPMRSAPGWPRCPGIGPDDAALTGADLRGRYDRLALALSATDGLAELVDRADPGQPGGDRPLDEPGRSRREGGRGRVAGPGRPLREGSRGPRRRPTRPWPPRAVCGTGWRTRPT